MPVITGIHQSPRQEGRFVIQVDGAPVATVAIETIERLQLAVGREVDALLPELERDGAALRTFDRALNMLAFRARSRTELRRQLVRKGEPAELVDAALERLARLGHLDDAAFARQLARAKLVGAGHSRRRLQQEMFKRGVDRETADEAIEEVVADEAVDEGAIVERVARKKLQSLARLDPVSRDRRLYAFLARRGYDTADIRRAIKAATGSLSDALDESTEDTADA